MIEKTKQVLAECRELDKNYNIFSEITEDLALSQAKANKGGKLQGIFITVKDCICIKDVGTHSSSRILNGYKPLFNATVIDRLAAEGAIIIGKTLQDEFGFGTFGTNTGLDFPQPKNPVDPERAPGGSSAGSGIISKLATFPHVSLGESTGGSIVNPAALCGTYGFCPTYGRVSRYGLLDYGNSLDKIGPMGNDPSAIAKVLEVISGFDENESTTLKEPLPKLDGTFKGKVGVIKEAFGEGISPDVKGALNTYIKQLRENGIEVEEISLQTPYEKGIATYYILSQSESSTNLAKYCGMRYGMHEEMSGNFNEYFSAVRSKHFGKEVKRRILIGTFARMVGFRDAYYLKAMKVRTRIINEYNKAFEKYDVLLSPTVPYVAPKFTDIEKMSLLETYMADVLTVGPNLAGLPHMNIPLESSMPVGAMFIAPHMREDLLIQLAK
ncbi:MAG: amidase family protein [Nanobdellota archaeon]